MTSENRNASNYDGCVTPGGPPQSRQAGPLRLTKLAVDAQTSNNCYFLECPTTGELVLVDAAADAPALLEIIGKRPLQAVITTHQHWDHHRALAEVIAATGATHYAGAPDADEITKQTGVPVDVRLADGDAINVGSARLSVIALAGHTPGSVALLINDPEGLGSQRHLITGDSLFPGGVGNTFGDKAAFQQLLGEVESKIFSTLPDHTAFYPGHGNDGLLGEERPALAEWRERGW